LHAKPVGGFKGNTSKSFGKEIAILERGFNVFNRNSRLVVTIIFIMDSGSNMIAEEMVAAMIMTGSSRSNDKAEE